MACLKHGGMHGHRHEQYPRRRRHVTPLDDWELVPVAELDGTACEGCSPPSAEPQAELQKPRCPKCGSYDTRKATVYWQCNTCHHEWLAQGEALVRAAGVRAGALGPPRRLESSSLDVNGDLMVLEDLDNAQGMARSCSAPTTRAWNASRARGARQPGDHRADYPPTREPVGTEGGWACGWITLDGQRDDGDYENDEALGRDGRMG